MTRKRKKQQAQPDANRGDAVKQRDEGPSEHGPSSRFALQVAEHSSTAIPPPSMLAAYNNAVPDGAERILRMAEEQQAHRHQLEAIVIRGDSRRADYGLYIGGLVIIVAIICGTVLVALGNDVQGLLIGIGSIIAALGAFVWGWRKRQQEVAQLRKGNTG